MADLTFTNDATERKAGQLLAAGVGEAATVKALIVSTIEVPASSANDTIRLGRIPSRARILGLGRIDNDDLATTGAPTLDIGLGSVDNNITNDPDALISGIDLASAGAVTLVLSDAANSGKKAWELVNGQTSDPGGYLDVYATIADAATNQAGSLTVELYGYID
jgi:hypothetical protein